MENSSEDAGFLKGIFKMLFCFIDLVFLIFHRYLESVAGPEMDRIFREHGVIDEEEKDKVIFIDGQTTSGSYYFVHSASLF